MIARMRLAFATLMLIAAAATPAAAQEQIRIVGEASVRIETTLGNIVVRLNANRAPLTVQNFVQYVVQGHYDGTIFHRVVPNFVAQAGGYLPDMTEREAERTVVNESGNGLSNRRGTIAMARDSAFHEASAQFYFNLVDNPDLDPRPTRWGFAVFGEVTEGLEVIDRISSVATSAAGDFDRDVPAEPIVIERIVLLED
jgi:peptidyl-prolyl cis-trans isomerase A (cyclophilin A)